MKKGKVKEKETKNKADMRRIPEGYVLCESGFPSLEELTKKSEAAHKLGYITINDLICVLASDDIYKKEELSAYWDSLQINKRKKFPNNIAMFEKRVSVWLSVLERLTSKSVNGSRIGLKPIIGLTGYKFITEDDRFIEDKDDPDYVKLDELKAYMIETARLPAPSLLFPEDNEQQTKTVLPDSYKKVPETKKAINFFTREGDYWHIGFEGKEAIIKKLDGLLYISYILANKETSLSCQELAQIVSKNPDGAISMSAAIEEGLNVGNNSRQEKSDKKAKQDYLKEYRKLQQSLDAAESNLEKQEIKEEMDHLLKHLKEKSFDPGKKNMQANIIKRISLAYEAMHKIKMSDMAKHLKDCIRTDDAYGLKYVGTLKWEITIR